MLIERMADILRFNLFEFMINKYQLQGLNVHCKIIQEF